MTKKILYLAVLGFLFLYFVASAAPINQAVSGHKVKTAPMTRTNLIRGDEPLPNLPYAPTRLPQTALSPGETVGWTQYDYQTNGSSGNRVAVDNVGGVHFDWMNGVTYPTTRKVSYNYLYLGTWIWPGTGTFAGYHTTGDGYAQLAVMPSGSPACAYHYAPTNNESTFVAIDAAPGIGSFSYYRPLIRFGSEHCIWPYISVDHQGYIHMVASEPAPNAGEEQTIGYIRSTTGGTSWSTPLVVDTTEVIGIIVTSSPVSNKVAVVYPHSTDTSSQWLNDVYYVQSLNGTTWDFRNNKVNVTNYGAGGDSLFAYTDLDAVYDYNDNLHIIWNAQYATDAGIYYSTRLFHYDVTSGNISEICRFDSTWADSSAGCDFGGWNFTIAKMSIGADPNNNALFATYTSWNLGDCSQGGYANGDIFMNYSTDGGATWTLRGNMTDSHTPDCEPGDCDSDHWSSLAETVNDNLHLFYVNDKDPGGVPQTEGVVTDNPMLYLAYPNPVRTHAIPDAPALVFPYNDSTYDNGYFLFDWMDPIGCTSFTIQVDDENTFNTPIFTATGITRSEYINVDDSLGVGNYWWRVKSAGYYGESAYGTPYHFEVIEGGPVCTYAVGDVNNNGSFNKSMLLMA